MTDVAALDGIPQKQGFVEQAIPCHWKREFGAPETCLPIAAATDCWEKGHISQLNRYRERNTKKVAIQAVADGLLMWQAPVNKASDHSSARLIKLLAIWLELPIK
jgi:hypothetical protein